MRALCSASVTSLLLVLGCSGPAPAAHGGRSGDASAPDAALLDAALLDAAVADAGLSDGGGEAEDAALDGSSGDAAAADGGGARSGLVSLGQASGGGAPSHVLFGLFAGVAIEDLRDGILFEGCAIEETSGACSFIRCPAGGSVSSDDAGELRASVEGTEVATATPGALGFYSDVGTGEVFAPGDVVTIAASGAEVPPFTADVVAPTAPAMSLPTTVSRAAPLAITWGATTAETMQLAIVGTTGWSIRCIVPAEDGALTVEPSILDGLAAGETVTLSASAFRGTQVVVGAYTIDVLVTQALNGSATVE